MFQNWVVSTSPSTEVQHVSVIRSGWHDSNRGWRAQVRLTALSGQFHAEAEWEPRRAASIAMATMMSFGVSESSESEQNRVLRPLYTFRGR